jgi:hypoxanthine phosphoribosyltransferase
MKKLNKRTPVHVLWNNLEFEIPSWDLIYRSLLNLAEAVRESGFEPDIIVGVCRGGWLPARIMSDLLEKPNIASVTAEFYVGVAETRGKPAITQTVSVPVKDKKVLVVDDVADTGESLKLVNASLKKQGVSEIRVVTIYYKPWSKLVPDYYEKETRGWVVFPWERKETVRKTLEKFRREGRTMDDAKEKLIRAGLDKKLVELFIEEIGGKHLD